MVKKTKEVTKKVVKKEVKAVLSISGTDYKGTGETVLGALSNIAYPMRVTEKGTLKVGKKELNLTAQYLRSLRGANTVAMIMLEKRFKTL